MKKTACTAFIILAAVISGCGGGYSCKETVDGVKCANVNRVYDEKVLNSSTATTVYNDKVVNRKMTRKALEEERKSRGMTDNEKIVRGIAGESSRPIHISPTILRIWTAPWEDEDGDLHQPGYIYCEMSQKRGRWVFGEQSAAKEATSAEQTRVRMPSASIQTSTGKADGAKTEKKYYGDSTGKSAGGAESLKLKR